MIRVLQDWHELGEAILALQRAGLPTHAFPQRNWDLQMLLGLLKGMPLDARLLDIGCREGTALRVVHATGFREVTGVDSDASIKRRIFGRVAAILGQGSHIPADVRRMHFNSLGFKTGSFDAAWSLARIEPAIGLAPFLEEVFRVLRPGGWFFFTAHYCEAKGVGCAGAVDGAPKHLFSRLELERYLQVARQIGFSLLEPGDLPERAAPTLHWQGRDSATIGVVLKKPG